MILRVARAKSYLTFRVVGSTEAHSTNIVFGTVLSSKMAVSTPFSSVFIIDDVCSSTTKFSRS